MVPRGQKSHRKPRSVGTTACAVLVGTAGTCIVTKAFAFQGQAEAQRAVTAAGVAAMLGVGTVATPPAAFAEEVTSLRELEAKLEQRDAGLLKIEQERKKPGSMLQKDLEKLEMEELNAARKAEQALLKRFSVEEKKAKARADAEEKVQKARIEKEEKDLKAKIDEQLQKDISKIEATEAAEIDAARKAEQSQKQAARAKERAERASAKSEDARVAAGERSEAAIIAADENAEKLIFAAKDKSEKALKAALRNAEAARIQAAENAEAAEKAAAEQAENSRAQAIERAELANKEVVEEEEQVERTVVEAVQEIEKEELVEENQGLAKAKLILTSVGSAALPVVLPGVLMAVYAFLASLVSPEPEPALGEESEETRQKMGRKSRIQTTTAALDPYEEVMQPKAATVSKVAGSVTAGAALIASVVVSSGTSAFTAGGHVRSQGVSRPLPSSGASAALSIAHARPPPSAAGSAFPWVGSALGFSAVCFLGASRRGTRKVAGKGASWRYAKVTAPAPSQGRASATALNAADLEVSEANPLRVIIAGGGVGGLVTAKALSKVPTIKVQILEQTSAFARFGGPIQLASNALSVIRDIDEQLFKDLMEKFTFTGCRRNGLVDALRTEWYCPFDAMETAADFFSLPYTGVVDRPDLQDVLLSSLPEGTLTNSRRVTSYEVKPDNAGVTVTCEDGTQHEADVYLGADGIWSATRAQMWNEEKKGPGSGCTYSGYIVFAGEAVYKPEDYFDVGYKVYMGPKRYFVTSDVGRGRIQWYAFISVPEGAQVPKEKSEKKEYIRSAFQGWSQQVIDLLDATPTGGIEDRALYDRPPSVLKSWADGPVALMGDACHPMMPNLGQGGCQAMEDGYAIYSRLKEVKNRSEVPELLQDYYRSRVVRASAIQGLSRIASDLLLSTFTFPWKPSEGLDSPYGPGRGDFQYDSVLVNYLKYLLPPIFNVQFSFLYSFHPYRWTAEEVKKLVGTVMDRHKEDAHAAWDNRMKLVESGEVDDEAAGPSFFTKVAESA